MLEEKSGKITLPALEFEHFNLPIGSIAIQAEESPQVERQKCLKLINMLFLAAGVGLSEAREIVEQLRSTILKARQLMQRVILPKTNDVRLSFIALTELLEIKTVMGMTQSLHEIKDINSFVIWKISSNLFFIVTS